MNAGIGKLVYGVVKLSPWAVKLESGALLFRPRFSMGGDCRVCALLDVVCEELETPCLYLVRRCQKPDEEKNCEACGELQECLGEKPCCWECPYLPECLAAARDWSEDYVRDRYNCSWEEFEAAIKMLAEG